MDPKSLNNTFFKECDLKLNHILEEISNLREDMKEKYNKLRFQFMLLTLSIGACLAITLHQVMASVFAK